MDEKGYSRGPQGGRICGAARDQKNTVSQSSTGSIGGKTVCQKVYSTQGVAAHLGLGRQLSQQVPVPHKPLIRLHHTGINVNHPYH